MYRFQGNWLGIEGQSVVFRTLKRDYQDPRIRLILYKS